MPTPTMFSFEARARLRGKMQNLHVFAQLDLSGGSQWRLVVMVNNARVGDPIRLPVTSVKQPPLEEALRRAKRRVADNFDREVSSVIYAAEPAWRTDG